MQVLLEANDPESAGFHLQQAVEKGLNLSYFSKGLFQAVFMISIYCSMKLSITSLILSSFVIFVSSQRIFIFPALSLSRY